MWLIDPVDVVITSGGSSATLNYATSYITPATSGVNSYSSSSNITASVIEAALRSGNVDIVSTGNITVNQAIHKTGSSSTRLLLRADSASDGSIVINQSITSDSNPFVLALSANGNVSGTGGLGVTSEVRFTMKGDSTYSGIISGAAKVTKYQSGILTLSGANTFTGATEVYAGTLKVTNASGLCTTAGATTVSS